MDLLHKQLPDPRLGQYTQPISERHAGIDGFDFDDYNYLTNINLGYYPGRLAEANNNFGLDNFYTATMLISKIIRDAWNEIASESAIDVNFIVDTAEKIIADHKALVDMEMPEIGNVLTIINLATTSPRSTMIERIDDALSTIISVDEILPPSLRVDSTSVPLYTVGTEARGKQYRFEANLRASRRHMEAYYYYDFDYNHVLQNGDIRKIRAGGIGFNLAGGELGEPNTMVITSVQGEGLTYKRRPRPVLQKSLRGLSEEDVNYLTKSVGALHPILSNAVGEDWLVYALRQTAQLGRDLGYLPVLIEMPRFNFNFQHDVRLPKFIERYKAAGFTEHIDGLYVFQG